MLPHLDVTARERPCIYWFALPTWTVPAYRFYPPLLPTLFNLPTGLLFYARGYPDHCLFLQPSPLRPPFADAVDGYDDGLPGRMPVRQRRLRTATTPHAFLTHFLPPLGACRAALRHEIRGSSFLVRHLAPHRAY